MIWEEQRWIVLLGVAVATLILLDELAYHSWKKANPGALYSHLVGKKNLTPLDPFRPPTTFYQ